MNGLYIHIPFCKKRCPYCAFVSSERSEASVMASYVDALLAELSPYAGKPFDTIYIGGGTPSVLPACELTRLIDGVFETVVYGGAEFTIEANPESADEAFFTALSRYPVSRVSFGVQSFDEAALAILGRIHTNADTDRAVALARKHLPDADVCIDLIYDIPGAPEGSSLKSLERATAYAPAHVSAYAYSFDTGHLEDTPPTEDTEMDRVASFLGERGYAWYEVSNFALPGHESVHNTGYWMMHEYLGIGAAAHSMQETETGRVRRENTADIDAYIMNPEIGRVVNRIDDEESFKESLCFGLRTTAGVDMQELERRHGAAVHIMDTAIENLVCEGLATWNDTRLTTTDRGRFVLDSVMSYLWQQESP